MDDGVGWSYEGKCSLREIFMVMEWFYFLFVMVITQIYTSDKMCTHICTNFGFWFWYYSVVVQEITIEGYWVKSTRSLSLTILATCLDYKLFQNKKLKNIVLSVVYWNLRVFCQSLFKYIWLKNLSLGESYMYN